jgi:hypothetical protein
MKEIEQLAKTQWEGCHGCDESDKYFWINGFVHGYLNARVDNLNRMNNKMNIHKLEKLGFYVTVVFASIVITLGFLALVGKVVMSIFN